MYAINFTHESKNSNHHQRARQVIPRYPLQAIEDNLLATYGCLLPSGEVTVPLVLPWTKEGVLGELKRQGKILAWKMDKDYEDGETPRHTPIFVYAGAFAIY